MKAIDRCINKLREVALDLTEPQEGASLEHQAAKIDGVVISLEVINELYEKFLVDLDRAIKGEASTNVHGGGTGEN